MKKIAIKGTNNFLLKYILKVVLSTIISVFVFTFTFSKASYKFDLDMKYDMMLSIFVCALCAAITAFVSVKGIKNNGLLLGAFAQIPLMFYSLLNVIFNENTFVFFLIKSVIVLLIGMLVGYVTSQKSRKLRIK